MRKQPARLAAADLINELAGLEPLKNREDKRRPIWTADSETDPFKKRRKPAPFLWGLYKGDGDYMEFEKTDDFVSHLSEQRAIVYAHNAGKFDWHFITEYIEDYEPLTIINGRLVKFMIGDCEFRDSFNIIPAPLSAYKKDEIDYLLFEKQERHKPENWQKIRDYLKSDCIYLHEMVTAFIAEYGLALTQASAAMNFWSKHSKTKKPASGPHYYEEMSRYYYGGRVQCFKTGEIKEPFKVIDIKSAYPRAMMQKHPWGLTYSTFDHLPEGLTDDEIGRSFITLECAAYGAFPLRTPDGLFFPTDNRTNTFHVSGWEFLAARDTDTLGAFRVIEFRRYADCVDFKSYVDYFYSMKLQAEQAGDLVRRLFAKLFLNSLYGKFASNPDNYEEWMTLPSHLIDAANDLDGWFFSRLLDEHTAVVNRPLPDEKKRYYDVAVSASITGWVRAYLWRSICACEGVLYCDTDSIAAKTIGNLPMGDALGDWELDADCTSGAIAGKKLYAFRKRDGTFKPTDGPWKIASKGVRLKAADIYEIANGGVVTYEPDVPTYSLKKGVIFTDRTIRMLDRDTFLA